jgi:hypothetical protein
MAAVMHLTDERARMRVPAWFGSARSELTRFGAAVARLVDDQDLERLRYEAFAVHPAAQETHVFEPTDDDPGNPDRWLESAAGGPDLQAFYLSSQVLALLRDQTGTDWKTSGGAGSYSYYRREGHHLGLHRDIDACELAAITCIADDAAAEPGLGGALRLYMTRHNETLAAIRSSPEDGALTVRLKPGETLLLLGGVVPHRLMPLGPDHLRIIAPLCYRMAA